MNYSKRRRRDQRLAVGSKRTQFDNNDKVSITASGFVKREVWRFGDEVNRNKKPREGPEHF